MIVAESGFRKRPTLESVDLGETVTFLIEVLNEGTCDLTELVVSDFIPGGGRRQMGNLTPAFQWSPGCNGAHTERDR